jgi:hypothetical protein
MNTDTRHELRNKAARLAKLLVQAKPVQMRFRSEEQFLEMLGLQRELVPVTVRAKPL